MSLASCIASSSLKTLALVLIFSFLFIQANAVTSLYPSYINSYCVDGTDDFDVFKDGSSRSTLMSDLATHASTYSFYSSKAGSGNNTLYGLFYCTATVDTQSCQTCVQKATNYCMYTKAAFVYYEECTLRYASRPVYATVDYLTFTAWAYSSLPAPSYTQFNDTLYGTLEEVIATSVSDSKRYASGEARLSGTRQKLYALAQCTPDIVASDCDKCLRAALGRMPRCGNGTCSNPQRKSILTYLPSCQLRYEVTSRSTSDYGFFPYSPSNSSPPRLAGKNVWYIMMALVVAAVALH